MVCNVITEGLNQATFAKVVHRQFDCGDHSGSLGSGTDAPPQPRDSFVRVHVFKTVNQTNIAVTALDLHAHFQHIGRIGNRAGHGPSYHSTTQIYCDALFTIVTFYNDPLKRIICAKLNCTVCGLSQYRWPDTEKETRTFIYGRTRRQMGLRVLL
jgi:hypothetical protein